MTQTQHPFRFLRSSAALFVGAAAIVMIVAGMLTSRPPGDPTWMGMELEPLTPDVATALGLPPNQPGVFVSDAVGVAVQSGMREGDVIIAVNGNPTPDTATFRQATVGLAGPAQVDLVRQGTVQSLVIDPAAATSTGAGSPSPALTVALPPACATCPGRAGCFPPASGGATPIALPPASGGVTPIALPPACATCPGRAGCFAAPGAPLSAPPLVSLPGAPLRTVALPCTTGGCPLP